MHKFRVQVHVFPLHYFFFKWSRIYSASPVTTISISSQRK